MDNSPAPQAGERRRHLARFHAVVDEAGLDEKKRRAFLKKITGKTSCSELSDEELAKVVVEIKPTRKQWSALSRLCRAMGYYGFEDPRFPAIAKHIAKAEDPGHLSRWTAAKLILGLTRCVKYKRRKAGIAVPNDPAPPPDSPPGNENAPTRDRRGVDLGGQTRVTCEPSVDPRQGTHDKARPL
jgi:hypothetical protein